MGYAYDVFLSYTRAGPIGEWVHEHLLDLFRHTLNNALNHPAKIFIDREGINTGDTWPERLKYALSRSKCIVAVWSPMYFHSNWCLAECSTMLYRERACGFRTLQNPSGLIFPLRAHDGEHYPPFARDIHHRDFRDYVRIGPGFRKMERYVEFQDQLIQWCDEIAHAIRTAPAWQEEWASPEWIEAAMSTLGKPVDTPMRAPVLG